MKLLDAEAKLLTNDELRAVLAEEVAGCQREGQVPPSLIEVTQYLEDHSATATAEQIRSFIEAVKPLKLVRSELLQLINLKPTSLVEVSLIVEEWEERLEDREQEVLDAVQRCLLQQ